MTNTMRISDINKSNKVRTISLFSGAGGLDIGAIRAGAHIIFANDMMKEACMSYRTNIGDHIVQGDINTLIDELAGYDDVDLVIGGPPCQGFSVAGKMDLDDPRSKLIWSYANVIEKVRPRAFIMENVKALGEIDKWKEIRTSLLLRFRKLGYSVNFIILNAKDFNVPQSRERVFFVGFNGDSSLIPDLERLLSPYRKAGPTVREALSVLDKAGTGNNTGLCNAKITLAENPILRKSPYAGMLFNGLGRPTKIDGYSATLPASMGGNKTPIIDERELYEHAAPWIVEYHKQVSDDPSSAEFKPAPAFLRRLTVEEAAVIQTFPQDYEFCGSQSSKYTQIGNAVPCNLGNAVARMVIDVLTHKAQLLYCNQDNLTLFMEDKYTVEKKDAEQLIRQLFANPIHLDDKIAKDIDWVIRGTHKTYKYVLVNALLAKSVNENIDALSLQAGDESTGAFDARSLCHSVLVPFERECVPNSLGNSNEPFLNKPARFPRLTTDNAVRSGNDRKTLELVISILSSITTSEEAAKYLSSALYTMKCISENYSDKFKIDQAVAANFSNAQGILALVMSLIKESCEGEVCPLIVAAVEQLVSPMWKIVPHKVNESGSSSKEVGDIDIYDEEGICKSIEVKDKNFTKEDVEHAITKFKAAGIANSLFIYGPNANFDAVEVEQLAARYGRKGTYCAIVSILDFVKIRLAYLPLEASTEAFPEAILGYAKEIEAKDTTVSWLRKCIEEN